MKIMENGIIRKMTVEEEEAFIADHENMAAPWDEQNEEASSSDYENALVEMGVQFND